MGQKSARSVTVQMARGIAANDRQAREPIDMLLHASISPRGKKRVLTLGVYLPRTGVVNFPEI